MMPGPTEAMPRSWRDGRRAKQPSHRNRRKARNHVANGIDCLEMVRVMPLPYGGARHLSRGVYYLKKVREAIKCGDMWWAIDAVRRAIDHIEDLEDHAPRGDASVAARNARLHARRLKARVEVELR